MKPLVAAVAVLVGSRPARATTRPDRHRHKRGPRMTSVMHAPKDALSGVA